MSQVNQVDQNLLTSLKRKIEEIAGLEEVESITQKDLEFIRFYVEENSGVALSLSTVKRIWRGDFHRLPHLSTLNALSQIAYKSDWLSHKKKYVESNNADNDKIIPSKNSRSNFIPIGVSLGIIFFLSMIFWNRTSIGSEGIKYNPNDLIFSFEKSVDEKVPNTVVFTYDIDDVSADKFYIQQSWDPSKRVEIFKKNYKQTDIYYTPGLYSAKLIADDSILMEMPVHITYNDWFLTSKQDEKIIYLDDDEFINKGHLGLHQNAFENGKLNIEREFTQAIYNSREFGVSGDDFSFSTKFKMQQSTRNPCPRLILVIKGESNFMLIPSGLKGCESEFSVRISDVVKNGKTNDLTQFGTNINEWQMMQVAVSNYKIDIQLNGNSIYSIKYHEKIGDIKEITYIFRGSGEVDDVILTNDKGMIIFEDHF